MAMSTEDIRDSFLGYVHIQDEHGNRVSSLIFENVEGFKADDLKGDQYYVDNPTAMTHAMALGEMLFISTSDADMNFIKNFDEKDSITHDDAAVAKLHDSGMFKRFAHFNLTPSRLFEGELPLDHPHEMGSLLGGAWAAALRGLTAAMPGGHNSVLQLQTFFANLIIIHPTAFDNHPEIIKAEKARSTADEIQRAKDDIAALELAELRARAARLRAGGAGAPGGGAGGGLGLGGTLGSSGSSGGLGGSGSGTYATTSKDLAKVIEKLPMLKTLTDGTPTDRLSEVDTQLTNLTSSLHMREITSKEGIVNAILMKLNGGSLEKKHTDFVKRWEADGKTPDERLALLLRELRINLSQLSAPQVERIDQGFFTNFRWMTPLSPCALVSTNCGINIPCSN